MFGWKCTSVCRTSNEKLLLNCTASTNNCGGDSMIVRYYFSDGQYLNTVKEYATLLERRLTGNNFMSMLYNY